MFYCNREDTFANSIGLSTRSIVSMFLLVLMIVLASNVQAQEAESTVVEGALGEEAEADILSGLSDWPENTNGELPMAGIFYGNQFTGVGVANARIALQSSRRFRAERTGSVTYVRYHNRTLNKDTITARCESFGRTGSNNDRWCNCVEAGLDEYTCGYSLGSSYHIGNGGKIVVEMHTDDGTGYPSDTVLGKTLPFVPMDNAKVSYPALQFESPVSIEEGKIYHLVFVNLNPPANCNLSHVSPNEAAACPRNQGAMGLNGVYMVNTPSTTGYRGPFRGDKSAANLYRDGANDSWSIYENSLSWYELGYTDGVAVGESYTALNAQSKARHTIGGSVRARQIFKVLQASRMVDGMWLNFGHTGTADGSPLYIELKNASGKVLASGSIEPSENCMEKVNNKTVVLGHWCQDWGYTSFEQPIHLLEGLRYWVEISGGAKSGFMLTAYDPLIRHEFTDRNHWNQARAELSTDSGKNWSDYSSVRPEEQDLALLFTIEGMPRQLP